MKYVVVDLECTCWDRNDPNYAEHETIEIGAVFLNETFDKVGEYNCFVRPINNSILSDYCTDLTGITQQQVNDGINFVAAMRELAEACPAEPITFCSWGGFDEKQLRSECIIYGVHYPFDECDHINIKAEFMSTFKRKKAGLQKACRFFGLRFKGVPHRGIDDANMIAEVFHRIRTKEKP